MPADLAVLCAIPLSEEEWLRPGYGVPASDFVQFASLNFERDAVATWKFFRTEAHVIARKLEAIAARGITVKHRATADDVRRAAASHRDIVVIAHWKGELVLHDDVRDLAQARALAAALSPQPGDGAAGLDARESVRCALNRFIDGPAPAPGAAAPLRQDAVNAGIARREYLNQFPALVQGNRLELWNGMLDAAAFSALFPDTFSGTVLTIVCTSDFLVETFRRQHLPTATCLCSRSGTRIGLAAAKLDAALALMQHQPQPLAQAWRLAGDMIDSIARSAS